MKILSIGAHPDDVEFGVGGLLIKEAQRGSEIKVVVCSLGEAGTNGTPEGRRQEAITAAKFYRAEVDFLDIGGDCHIEYKPASSLALAKIIRQFKPDLVLTESLAENQHPDHLAVAKITRDACRLARYGGLEELKNLPVHKVSGLFYFPSSAELNGRPDVIIDVSEVQSLWEQAMAAHTSQMKTKDYLNLVNSRSAYFGKSIGVDFALGLWANEPLRLDYLSDLTSSARNY